MPTVTSNDGTSIAYERVGQGPALILVAGALQPRTGQAKLAELLANQFTVLNYDRRGRGESGDTLPYAVEREIEDLAAVMVAADDAPFLYGTSSGATLVLKAAASGLEAGKLVLWEPNFLVDDSRPPLPADYVAQLEAMVEANRRGDAVEYFMTAGVGMPAQFVAPMRNLPFWPALEAAAHTLPYDGRIVADTLNGKPVAAARWTAVTMPALVLDGGTTPWLSAGAAAIARALPNAHRRTLYGQTHDVAAEAIAPAITEFLKG
jgi:alpha-beta hydrolase superfamily lysophospholipase